MVIGNHKEDIQFRAKVSNGARLWLAQVYFCISVILHSILKNTITSNSAKEIDCKPSVNKSIKRILSAQISILFVADLCRATIPASKMKM